MPIKIATDGSCIQQGSFRAGDDTPRPSAWAFVAQHPDGRIVRRADPFPGSTIGRMEVMGLLRALEYVLFTNEHAEIVCDSQYVVNGYNEWLASWSAKNFVKKGGLAHADLWREIDRVKDEIAGRVTVRWVKAHQANGNRLNAMADEAANTCARTQIAVDDRGDAPKAAGPSPEILAAKRRTDRSAEAEALLSSVLSDQRLARFVAAAIHELVEARDPTFDADTIAAAGRIRDALEALAD